MYCSVVFTRGNSRPRMTADGGVRLSVNRLFPVILRCFKYLSSTYMDGSTSPASLYTNILQHYSRRGWVLKVYSLPTGKLILMNQSMYSMYCTPSPTLGDRTNSFSPPCVPTTSYYCTPYGHCHCHCHSTVLLHQWPPNLFIWNLATTASTASLFTLHPAYILDAAPWYSRLIVEADMYDDGTSAILQCACTRMQPANGHLVISLRLVTSTLTCSAAELNSPSSRTSIGYTRSWVEALNRDEWMTHGKPLLTYSSFLTCSTMTELIQKQGNQTQSSFVWSATTTRRTLAAS